jgi:hypothetical protein
VKECLNVIDIAGRENAEHPDVVVVEGPCLVGRLVFQTTFPFFPI